MMESFIYFAGWSTCTSQEDTQKLFATIAGIVMVLGSLSFSYIILKKIYHAKKTNAVTESVKNIFVLLLAPVLFILSLVVPFFVTVFMLSPWCQ